MSDPTMHGLFDGSDLGLIPDGADRLDEVLAILSQDDAFVCTGDEIRCHDGNGCECADNGMLPAMDPGAAARNFLRGHGPALRTLLAEHEALLRRVADAPVGTVDYDAHPFLTIDDADMPPEWEGQRVRILAEPGEVG